MSKFHEAEMLDIGGIKQWVRATGEDKSKPVLLFIHGGPGLPEGPFVSYFTPELEEHFIVVQWDQRATGNTYDKAFDISTMVINQYVKDTLEVTEYLLKKYNKKKLYILGHSWGTVPALYAIKQRPELFHAYIGVGQIANLEKGEEIGYNFTLDRCRKENDKKGIEALEKIGPAVNGNCASVDWVQTERKYLLKYEGMFHDHKTNVMMIMFKAFLKDKDYGLKAIIRYLKLQTLNLTQLWPSQLAKLDFFQEIKEVAVPFYILQGEYDYMTTTKVAKEYFDLIKAPIKRFYLFDNSAHCPIFEEPQKFLNILTNEILPETNKK